MKVFNENELGPELGYLFWLRVDNFKNARRCQLIDMVSEAGIDYTRIKNRSSENRLLKLEDSFQIAGVLDCSIAYFLTGASDDDSILKNLQPFIRALINASEDDLELV